MLRVFKSAVLLILIVVFTIAANSQSKVPGIKYQERTLSNGLKVYTVENHSNPTVAIQVWYKVGSKDDPEGRSGFAHLFEHMMFKSTRNMPAEMLDRLTEDVGGFNNAFTTDDVTVYFEAVPSNYLETLLWAEADRMGSLNVDEENFKSEREVVKEEFRQNYLTPPYGQLELLIQKKSFTVHPYRRPGIGSIEDLDAATLADVKEFHRTYYRPDNATLIVVGDFDQKQLDAWIDKYFGKISKPDTPLPRVQIKEPERTAERRYVDSGEHAPLPAIALTYLVPPAASKDVHSLKIAEAILSRGDSSRLYTKLIYEKQLAQSADALGDYREDPAIFIFRVTLSSGKSLEEAESVLLSEIEKLRASPIGIVELAKARNQVVTEELLQRQTNTGKALALGEAAVLFGDASRVNKDIDAMMAVTANDIKNVMRRYFAESNRVVIHFLPKPGMREGRPGIVPVATVDAGAIGGGHIR